MQGGYDSRNFSRRTSKKLRVCDPGKCHPHECVRDAGRTGEQCTTTHGFISRILVPYDDQKAIQSPQLQEDCGLY